MNINKSMTKLNTPYMRNLLNKAMRSVKRRKMRTPDETLSSIYYFYNKSGWKYQVDLINDTRFHARPRVCVFAFNPRIMGCERADYYLDKSL